MRRVVILDPLWPLDVGREALDGIDVVLEQTDRIEGDDVVAVLAAPEQTIPVDLLDRAPNVRLVGTCSTGYDNLPVEALSALGIRCIHVKSLVMGEAWVTIASDTKGAIRNGAVAVTPDCGINIQDTATVPVPVGATVTTTVVTPAKP